MSLLSGKEEDHGCGGAGGSFDLYHPYLLYAGFRTYKKPVGSDLYLLDDTQTKGMYVPKAGCCGVHGSRIGDKDGHKGYHQRPVLLGDSCDPNLWSQCSGNELGAGPGKAQKEDRAGHKKDCGKAIQRPESQSGCKDPVPVFGHETHAESGVGVGPRGKTVLGRQRMAGQDTPVEEMMILEDKGENNYEQSYGITGNPPYLPQV